MLTAASALTTWHYHIAHSQTCYSLQC